MLKFSAAHGDLVAELDPNMSELRESNDIRLGLHHLRARMNTGARTPRPRMPSLAKHATNGENLTSTRGRSLMRGTPTRSDVHIGLVWGADERGAKARRASVA